MCHVAGTAAASAAAPATDFASDREARAEQILQRLGIVAPFVIGGDDGAGLELVDAGIADMLVDARVLPVDGAAADLAAARAHAAGTRRVRHGAPRHAAFADDELVPVVPSDA